MELSPSPTLPKARNNHRVIGVIAAVLVAAIFGIGGWTLLRRAQASTQREKRAAEEQAKAAAQKSGEDTMAARAISNYLARVHAQLRDHAAVLRRLQQDKVFSWNIHQRSEIDTDRQIVRDFLTTNSRITDSVQYGADLIRAELDSAKVPADVRDSALALYAKSQVELLPLQMHVRHCDQVLGERALAVLDLLDLNWGTWHRDEASGRLDFNNSITLAIFKDYAEKTKAAAAAQQAAQDELIAYQRRHPER